MSVYAAHRGHGSGLPGAPASPRSSSPNGLGLGSTLQQPCSSDVSERENDDRRPRDINSTYVISACKTPGDTPLTPHPAGRLTLQRRVTRNKESSLLGREVGESSERKTETHLRLQRCIRAGSGDRQATAGAGSGTQSGGGAAAGDGASGDTGGKARIVGNEKNSPMASSSAPGDSGAGLVGDEKDGGTFSALGGANGSVTREYFSHSTPIRSQKEAEAARPGHLAMKPAQSPLDVRVSGTGNLHRGSHGKDVAKSTSELESLGKGTPAKRPAGHTWTPRCGTPQPQSAAMSTPKPRTPGSRGQRKSRCSLFFSNKREGSREHTLPPTEEAAAQGAPTERDPLKAEDSQVTVAVRVRPFSTR